MPVRQDDFRQCAVLPGVWAAERDRALKKPITIKIPRSAPAAVSEKILFYGGAVAIAYGAWMVYHPAGFIVAGAIAAWMGMGISVERDETPGGR